MTRSRELVRVAFLDFPPLLAETLAAELRFENAGQFDHPDALLDALRTGPDIVVVGAGRFATGAVARQCLIAAPELSVVTLTHGGRDAVMYARCFSSTQIDGISLQLLGELIREAHRPVVRSG